MGTTPIFGIPYVEPTDTLANYPVQDKNQAEAVEAALGNRPYCDAYATVTQSLANASETGMVFQGAQQSDPTMWVSGATIRAPRTGLYLVIMGYSFAATAGAGSRIVIGKQNGFSTRSFQVAYGAGNCTGTITLIRRAIAGDTFGFSQYQSSGAVMSTYTQAAPALQVLWYGNS